MSLSFRSIVNALTNPVNLKIYVSLLQEELSEPELREIFDVPDREMSVHLDELQAIDLIESRYVGGNVLYQARSNPYEEARQQVLDEGSELWTELHQKIRRIKQDRMTSVGV